MSNLDIFMLVVGILSIIGIFHAYGRRHGGLVLLYVVGVLTAYGLFLKIWGQQGKTYLIFVLLPIVIIVFVVRIRKGKSIW